MKHTNHGNLILVLNTEDLLPEGSNFIETAAGGDGVDTQETLSSTHVLVSHGTVLLLTSSIKNIKQACLFINGHLLALRGIKEKYSSVYTNARNLQILLYYKMCEDT